MPQIPVYTGSQRLDPGSPVSAVSAEGSAGALSGRAVEEFGNAVFNLGNKLDEAAKNAKAKIDKESVDIAVNEARYKMLEAKAAQKARGVDMRERADGFDAVDGFKSNVDPQFKLIEESLQDPTLQKMFRAKIGDDFIRESQLVLTDEVEKREKAVPILQQNTLNGRAAIARKDFKQTEKMMLEAATDIYSDPVAPEAAKLNATLQAQKMIAEQSIAGLLDDAKVGKVGNFFTAREVLRDKFAKIFNKDEMVKIEDRIDSEQNQYFTLKHNIYVHTQEVIQKQIKADESKSVTLYTKELAAAGNDQFKFNAIQEKIQRDPTLTPEAVTRLAGNRVFMETKDDDYEGKFMTELLKKKNFAQMIDRVNADYFGSKVSSKRRDKLLTATRNMQEYNQKDPFLTSMVSQARDEIDSNKKPPTFDVVSGMYKSENDTYNEQAQTLFMQKITTAAQQGALTPEIVQTVKQSILNTYYGGSVVAKPVIGVSPESLTTSKGIQDTLDQAYKEYKTNGHTWSPDRRKKEQQRIKGLLENKDIVKKKEDLKVNTPFGSSKKKVYDE